MNKLNQKVEEEISSMKKSKLSLVLTTVISLAILASACSGQTNTNQSTALSTTLSTALSSTSASQTETPATEAEKPVTIVYESWSPTKATMDEIVAAFNKVYPNITVEVKLHANFSEFLTALKTEVAASNCPDVFQFDSPTSLAQLNYQMEPLDEIMVKEYGDGWKDLFLSGPLSDMTMDGKLMGIPFNATPAGVIWYNKTMFDKYGIQEPKTYSDLKAAAEILAANNLSGMFIGNKDSWCTIDQFQMILNEMAPGKQYDAFAGKIKFTDPEIITAFDTWKKFFDDKVFQNDSFSMTQYMDAYNSFIKDQKGAMWSNGTWSLDIYSNKDLKSIVDGIEWGVMAMPDLNNDGKLAPLLSTVGGTSISKDSEHKDAAMKLIDFMTFGEGQNIMVNTFLGTPPLVKTVSPTIQLTANAKQNYDAIATLIQNQGTAPRGISNPKVADKLYEVLTKVAYGEMTSQAAAEEVQKVIDAK